MHLHTHDTAGGQLATLLAAVNAGVDAVDVASAPMAGTTSQVPASALVAALENTDRATALDLRAVMDLEPYWEAVRKVYTPFESGLPAPTGRVYDHEIPGGQLSNLRQQAIALGLGEKFEQIEAMYAAANVILGRVPKVTPSSKVVGDLALHLVAVGADPAEFAANPQDYDIPDSVIGFLARRARRPARGWPEPFRTRALQGRTVKIRDDELSEEDSAALDEKGRARQATLNRLLFPGPTKDFLASRETYGNVSRLDTLDYLYGLRPGHEHVARIGKGVSLIFGLSAIGDADERGMRTVMCTMNGQLRPIRVRDTSIKVDVKAAERADPSKPGHVAGAVRRSGVGNRRRGRRGGRRRDGGDHRGHEDGGRHHRSGCRGGAAAGHRVGAAGRGWRPRLSHRAELNGVVACRERTAGREQRDLISSPRSRRRRGRGVRGSRRPGPRARSRPARRPAPRSSPVVRRS